MKIVPISISNFNINGLKHCFTPEELNAIDRGKLEELCQVVGTGDWKQHTYVTFYIDCPEDAIQILTNANLFTMEHSRGSGVLSGPASAFERFVLRYSNSQASVQERALANVFYNMLKVQFQMFKEYKTKQLTDRTFTMEK